MTPPPSAAQEYTEDLLIEQPAIELLCELGWHCANLYGEWNSGVSSEGRQTQQDVILRPRLRRALERLNPNLPAATRAQAIEAALDILTADRSALLPVNANREIYELLKNGVKVEVTDSRGISDTETLRIIDWRNTTNNDFFLA
jgi:type I restriction enzyme, R subunit